MSDGVFSFLNLKDLGYNKKRSFITKENAFTLIELTASIVIIAIVATAGFITLGVIETNSLNAQADKIIADMALARQMAVSSHQICYVNFDTTNKTYAVLRGMNQIKSENLEVDSVSVTDLAGNPVSGSVNFTFPLGRTQERFINLSKSAGAKQMRLFSQTGYCKIQ